MQVRAKTKFIRISPRKVRLVVDQVRGLSVDEAEHLLQFMNKKAAEPVLKLVKSAVANATHNYKLKREQLFISAIHADEGFKMKRFMPRAFGRASAIKKRTSHISIVLDERLATPAPVAKTKPEKSAEQAEKPLSPEPVTEPVQESTKK